MPTRRRRAPARIVAYYSGKVVGMDYIPDPKQRFSLACYRVRDNVGEGYVLEGEKLYRISPASRMAKIVLDSGERERVLAEIQALEAQV